MSGIVTLQEDCEPDATTLEIAERVFKQAMTGMDIARIVPVPDGWHVEYNGISGYEEGDRIYVSAEGMIYAPDDGFAGVITREYAVMEDGTRVVFHRQLHLLEQYQKQKFSRTAVMQAPKSYKALGFEEVRIVAADAGRYVWARFGFDWRTKKTRDDKVSEFSSFLSEAYEGITDAQIEGWAAEATVSPEHLSNAHDEDGRHIGKIFLLDAFTSSWEGLLRLT